MPHLPTTQLRFTLPSVTGGVLAAVRWAPAQRAPRGIVVMAHGHKESLARYELPVTAFVQAGFAVYGPDHHGHGRSSGTRALLPRFDILVDDLEHLAIRARAEFPSLPVVIFGHSMGGLTALRYAMRHSDEIAAVIATGPALTIDETTSDLERSIGTFLARIAPAMPLPARGDDGGGRLTVDPETDRQFAADHRNHHGQARAATAVAMLEAGKDARARAATLTAPVLILHGADDEICFPSGSTTFIERAGSADKTLEIIPGNRHEVLQEPTRHDTMARIIAWLDERVPAAAP